MKKAVASAYKITQFVYLCVYLTIVNGTIYTIIEVYIYLWHARGRVLTHFTLPTLTGARM